MKVSEIIDQLVEYRREYGDVEVDRGILVPGGVMLTVPEGSLTGGYLRFHGNGNIDFDLAEGSECEERESNP